MSDDDQSKALELKKREDVVAKRAAVADAAYDQFSGLVQIAISTVTELCELGDSESVRLDAAKTILKMAGVDPGQKKEVNVSVDDRRAVRAELEAVLTGLARNNPAVVDALTASGQIDARD